MSSGSKIAMWNRYARSGEINYHINREHPLIAALFDSGDGDERATVKAALLAIEQGFPIDEFGRDAANRPDDMHLFEGQASRFREFLEAAIPVFLVKAGGNFKKLKSDLRQTEPFCSNWAPVEEYLEDKGWVDAGT